MKMSLFYHVLPTYNSLPFQKAVKTAFVGSQQAHRKAQSWMEAMRCQMNREAWFTLVATCMGYACSSKAIYNNQPAKVTPKGTLVREAHTQNGLN